MRPEAVRDSDALRNQLQETGQMTIHVNPGGRIDLYVDAVRTISDDLGLNAPVMLMLDDYRFKVTAYLDCSACNASGRVGPVEQITNTFTGRTLVRYEDCPTCRGYGHTLPNGTPRGSTTRKDFS